MLSWACGYHEAMQVDKREFDAVLGKLLKSEPLPKAAIAPKKASPLQTPKRKALARTRFNSW